MFSETLLVFLMMLLCLQGSSLWGTLIVVPTSLILVYSFSTVNVMSGLLMIIYVMVFIGGLLIFLMSVASITPQEQSLSMSNMFSVLTVVSIVPVLFVKKKLSTSLSWMMLSIWFWGESALIVIMIMILLLTLFVLTKFFMVYKGFVRSM